MRALNFGLSLLCIITVFNSQTLHAQDVDSNRESEQPTIGIGEDGREYVLSDPTPNSKKGELRRRDKFRISNRIYSFDYISADQQNFTPYMAVTPYNAKPGTAQLIFVDGTGPTQIDAGHWLAPLVERSEISLYSLGKPGAPSIPMENVFRPNLVKDGVLRELKDVSALIDRISKIQNFGPIFICGHSQGGYIALKTTQENEKVRGAITIASPTASWGAVMEDQLKTIYRSYFNLADTNHDQQVDKTEITELRLHFSDRVETLHPEIQSLVRARESASDKPPGHTLNFFENLLSNKTMQRAEFEAKLTEKFMAARRKWEADAIRSLKTGEEESGISKLLNWSADDTRRIRKPLLIIQGMQDQLIGIKDFRKYQQIDKNNPQRFFLELEHSGHVPWQNNAEFDPRDIRPLNDDVSRVLNSISDMIKKNSGR